MLQLRSSNENLLYKETVSFMIDFFYMTNTCKLQTFTSRINHTLMADKLNESHFKPGTNF